jgi:dihydrofolate reductase
MSSCAQEKEVAVKSPCFWMHCCGVSLRMNKDCLLSSLGSRLTNLKLATWVGRWGNMGKLVFGMMQSLDGYVAGAAGGPELPPPAIALHRYFNDRVRGLAGSLYGRRMYEVMRYWDEDRPEWGAVEQEFAAAWRAQPKWVASRSLKSVGANATLVGDDVEAFVRRLKAEVQGDIDVAGPDLAGSLTDLGLIDEYHLYFRPFVLGRGKPYFAGARPPLRLVAINPVGEDAVRLTFSQ